MMRRRLGALFLALLCAAGMAACTNPSNGDNGAAGSSQSATSAVKGAFPGTPGDELVVMDVGAEPAELNPMLLKDGVGVDTIRHFMAGLARLDAQDNAVPDVAERWEANADNTQLTVHLRKDATWSDGSPVTAHDFYFSWVTQMKKETGTIFANYLYSNIKNGEAFYNGQAEEAELGLKVLDDYTLQIDWSRPMISAGYFLAFPVYFPINQKAYEQFGAEQYGKQVDQMLTNGPYNITEWVHGDHILLERNESYFDAERILIPQIKLLFIGDSNTRLNAFMAGELDVGGLYSEQIEQVQAMDEQAIASYIDGGSWYLRYNLSNPQLANANLRRALAYAVDVQSLLDNVIRDGSVVADGLVPHVIAGAQQGEPYADARGSLFAYDPQAAKDSFAKALEELGVGAADIKLSLMTNDSSYGQTQGAYLQQQWKEQLGIDVTLQPLAWQARIEAQQSGDYDFFVEGWGPNENDAITFLENFTSDSPNNNGGFRSDAYDELIGQVMAQGDPAIRQQLMIDAEKLLMEEMVVGPLYFTCTSYAVSNKLEGLVRTPFQLFNFCEGAKINQL